MNSPGLYKSALQQTNRDLAPIWKRGWIIFVSFVIVIEFCHYLLMQWAEFVNPEWAPPIADFMAGLLASGFYILIIPVFVRDLHENRPQTNFFAHMRAHFNQVMIEMVRVMAKVIIGLVLFIIPGLVWSVQLSFVPLVTQFDPNYLAGKVDALRQSESMVKGRFWSITGISVLFFAISWFESFKYAFPLYSPQYLLLVGASLFIEVYVYMFFFSVYERLAKTT